jgi:hypothetical protein
MYLLLVNKYSAVAFQRRVFRFKGGLLIYTARVFRRRVFFSKTVANMALNQPGGIHDLRDPVELLKPRSALGYISAWS